ncbi:hypothetical protein EGW08_007910, partial [Elysia chlorotica]
MTQLEFEAVSGGGNKTGCVPISDFGAAYSKGIDTFSAATALMDRIIRMCDANPYLYDSLDECAQVPYTCLTHFSTMAPCKTFLDRCGLSKAQDCILDLTSGQCNDAEGGLAVMKEVARLDNQMNDICDPYPFYLVDDPVSSDCRTAMDSCATETLTAG